MKIVDLFSGAGGLTFGFLYRVHRNRFVLNKDNHILFANEINSKAAKAFRINFPDTCMIEMGIEELEEKTVKAIIGEETIDLVIGGPPCQSFSTVGKRCYDDRARLYEQYRRLLTIIKPKAFLFENVTGILTMRDDEGNSVINTIFHQFESLDESLGYNCYRKTLNAVDFGVPQNRERVFIVGIRDDLNLEWEFPRPRHQRKITLEDAISDFPVLEAGQEVSEYDKDPQNRFQRLMRDKSKKLSCHFASNYGDKICTIIRNVKPGEGKNQINKLVEEGKLEEKYKLTSGYRNSYGRLYKDKPCTTITHNMSTPSGLRCIHYEQNRALTPREGARIQSFPDWFQFVGSHSDIKQQIGNAVPPLLAMAFAERFKEVLEA